jgi:fructosamine-3-kinase
METFDERLINRLLEETGREIGPAKRLPVSGGCIHQCWILEGRWGSCFVKANREPFLPMFESERDGLRQLAASGAIRVPEPFLACQIDAAAVLIMERLDLRDGGDVAAQGRALAAVHRTLASDDAFGWHRDNFIGSTPQPNRWSPGWGEFFAEQRIEHQLRLNRRAGSDFRGSRRLADRVMELVGEHNPASSLLHGDLWGGNASFDAAGQPLLFDPATYFGDRETDLAFSRLFGGFDAAFYREYQERWPVPEGWEDRAEIYNLYHLLNHTLLFGGNYGVQAQRIIDRFV